MQSHEVQKAVISKQGSFRSYTSSLRTADSFLLSFNTMKPGKWIPPNQHDLNPFDSFLSHHSHQSYDPSTQQLLTEAKEFLSSENYVQAKQLLEGILAQDDRNIEALILMAFIQKSTKDNHSNESPETYLKKALMIEENNVIVLFRLGSLYIERGKFQCAIECFGKLDSLKPNDSQINFHLAVSHEHLNHTNEAKAFYQKALSINPVFSAAIIKYCTLLVEASCGGEAKKLLQDHIKNAPFDEETISQLEAILNSAGQAMKKNEEEKELLLQDIYNQGVFYFKQNQLVEALEKFREVIELPISNSEPLLLLSHVNIAMIYERQVRFDSAILVYQEILNKFKFELENASEIAERILQLQEKSLRKSVSSFRFIKVQGTNQKQLMSLTHGNFSRAKRFQMTSTLNSAGFAAAALERTQQFQTRNFPRGSILSSKRMAEESSLERSAQRRSKLNNGAGVYKQREQQELTPNCFIREGEESNLLFHQASKNSPKQQKAQTIENGNGIPSPKINRIKIIPSLNQQFKRRRSPQFPQDHPLIQEKQQIEEQLFENQLNKPNYFDNNNSIRQKQQQYCQIPIGQVELTPLKRLPSQKKRENGLLEKDMVKRISRLNEFKKGAQERTTEIAAVIELSNPIAQPTTTFSPSRPSFLLKKSLSPKANKRILLEPVAGTATLYTDSPILNKKQKPLITQMQFITQEIKRNPESGLSKVTFRQSQTQETVESNHNSTRDIQMMPCDELPTQGQQLGSSPSLSPIKPNKDRGSSSSSSKLLDQQNNFLLQSSQSILRSSSKLLPNIKTESPKRSQENEQQIYHTQKSTHNQTLISKVLRNQVIAGINQPNQQQNSSLSPEKSRNNILPPVCSSIQNQTFSLSPLTSDATIDKFSQPGITGYDTISREKNNSNIQIHSVLAPKGLVEQNVNNNGMLPFSNISIQVHEEFNPPTQSNDTLQTLAVKMHSINLDDNQVDCADPSFCTLNSGLVTILRVDNSNGTKLEKDIQNKEADPINDSINQKENTVYPIQEIPGKESENVVEVIIEKETAFEEKQAELEQIPEKKEQMHNDTEEEIDRLNEVECIKRMIQNPKNHAVLFRLASIYFEKDTPQYFEQAKNHFLILQSISPEYKLLEVNEYLGEIYEKQKDYSSALNCYKKLYGPSNEKQTCLLKVARCLQKLKNYQLATRSYLEAMRLNTKNYLPYLRLGWMQTKQWNESVSNKTLSSSLENSQQLHESAATLKSGIDFLHKAHSLCPNNLEINIKLGKALLMIEEDKDSAADEAIRYLSIGLSFDPQNYDCLIGLSKAYERKNLIPKAIECCLLSIDRPDPCLNSILYLGMLYLKNKEYRNAEKQLRNVLNSENLNGLIEYATTLCFLQKYEKAKKYFRHALKLDKKNVIANLRLGKLYQGKLKDIEKAIYCYEQIISVEPGFAKARYQLGLALMEKKEYKSAIEQFKETLRINFRFTGAYKAIGLIYYENNNPTKAIRFYQKALECDPLDMESKLGLANCFYLSDNLDEALINYEEISALEKNDEIEYNLGNCYYMKGFIPEAIEHFKTSLSLKFHKSDCHYNLGNAYCIQENFEEALLCFQRAFEFDPFNAAAAYNLANSHYVLRNNEMASVYFEKALQLDPINVEWLNYIAGFYLNSNDCENARKHLEASFRLEDKNVDTLFKLAQLNYKDSQFETALHFINVVNQLSSYNEEIESLKSDILFNLPTTEQYQQSQPEINGFLIKDLL